MTENAEQFDNICINSRDSDVNVDIIANCNNTEVANRLTPDLYYFDGKTNGENHSSEKVLIDESSNDSDEITFIRQISKPLLNNQSNRKHRMRKRLHLQYQRRWTKLIGLCFSGAIVIAMVVLLIFLLLPNGVRRYLNEKMWGRPDDDRQRHSIVGCDQMTVEEVWISNFPLMITEGAVRLVRVNDDAVIDVVMPFGTNALHKIECKIYYPEQKRCFGGLLALDGATGAMLWRYDAIGEMYSLVCMEDLNNDGYIDCLGAGRKGTFAAVNARNGHELWSFDDNRQRSEHMNLYTAQFIDDIDHDGVRDIVQIHGGDQVADPSVGNRLAAKLMILSGRTGRLLVSTKMPDNHESYYSPQLVNLGDGFKKILFGTGGETFPGSLFEIDLNQMINFKGDTDVKTSRLYRGSRKGVMTPPVLVDLNADGRADIVICPFGDECLAIDGLTFKQIWKFDAIKDFETYATPAAGYYNDDDVPDIFIQISIGLGYPVYSYGTTLILDGRDGKLIKNVTRSNNLVMSSPLTLSMEGHGNDMFLYWSQLCRGHEDEINDKPFQNLPQHVISRAHTCKVRFNTTTISLFLIHGKHLLNQSTSYCQIYNNENYFHIEHNYLSNRTENIEKFLRRNPQYRRLYEKYVNDLEIVDLAKTQANYASNKNPFHDNLMEEQRRLENINIDDSFIHNLVDLNSPSEDEINSNSKDEYLSDNSYEKINKRFRYARNSEHVLLRSKRHNGPHDAEGLQRLISTGTLAPPILDHHDKYFNHSMDVIFFTYWSIPHEIVLQTKMEIKCNTKWSNMEPQRFRNDSKYFHYDHDHYTKYGNIYCAKKYGRDVPLSDNEKQSTVFNSHVGQLTAYRKRLRCTCSAGRVGENQRCGRILPFHLQTWPAYLGLGGTAYWNSTVSNLKFMKEL